jgi:hypothetical protein
VNYSRYSYDIDIGTVGQVRQVRRWPARVLLVPLLPVGWVLSRRDRRSSVA